MLYMGHVQMAFYPGITGMMGDRVSSPKADKIQKAASASAKSAKSNRLDKSVGTALRAVYHDAVSERVPDEMLDLLSKLG